MDVTTKKDAEETEKEVEHHSTCFVEKTKETQHEIANSPKWQDNSRTRKTPKK